MARTKLQTPNFNLSRRADGYYEIRYTEDGKLRSKSTGSKDPVEAEKVRANFVEDYRKPKLAKNPTVQELADAYRAYRETVVASPETLKYSFAPITRHLGSLYASNITQSVVNGYGVTRGKERPVRSGGRYGDRPVSEATISKELRMLRAALNWAASEKLIDREPSFRIELSAGDPRTDWITKEEAAQLMAACSPHLALFLRIALSTAKRREAILSLKWDNVTLHLKGHEQIDFGGDVGNKRRGVTPIAGNTKLIAALEHAKTTSTSDYMIEYRGDRILDVKTALSAACRRAGVKHISAHTLKHTSITWMVQAGMSYEKIAKATHTSKEIIERVYGHHNPAFLAEVSSAVSF